MIKSKAEYREFLKADKEALFRKGKSPKFTDLIWKYEIALRTVEYYNNVRTGWIWGGYYCGTS